MGVEGNRHNEYTVKIRQLISLCNNYQWIWDLGGFINEDIETVHRDSCSAENFCVPVLDFWKKT
jgi:hypothetical protein